MTLVIDGARMEALLRGPEGPVTRHLIERATVFQAAAKRQVPVVTGCLRDSIVKRVEVVDGEVCVRVIADTVPCSPTRTAYSLYVHEGTAEHDIRPKNPDGVLAFFWADGPDGPGTYFFKKVHHPGTQPNRFFSDNLWIVTAPR